MQSISLSSTFGHLTTSRLLFLLSMDCILWERGTLPQWAIGPSLHALTLCVRPGSLGCAENEKLLIFFAGWALFGINCRFQ